MSDREANLLESLYKLPDFSENYTALLQISVQEQLGLSPENSECKLDDAYLIRCAGFLARVNCPSCQDAALRIAQFYMQRPEVSLNILRSCEFILNALSNRRALLLASDRGFNVSNNPEWTSSVVGKLNWVKEGLSSSIWISDHEKIDVNRFQCAFWNALEEHDQISVSAPTSAGKSFVVKLWVQRLVAENVAPVIVYLVPTRALISEVEGDFRLDFIDGIKSSKLNLTSLPYHELSEENKPCIYVLTQERLQLLYRRSGLNLDLLIVDEAYKIADESRGVLLQHVIEKTLGYNIKTKTVYLSPLAENPQLLVEGLPNSFAECFEQVTINQNLIWVTQVRGKKWNLHLCVSNGQVELPQLILESNPSPASLRLPMVAHALGSAGGNIIYVNRASDAEKCAAQLEGLIGFDNQIEDESLNDLIQLCRKTIHRDFGLISALKYGIAFHYGNMPSLIRSEIERLFREGKIKFLICTSTLVEGVNLPCKNIFIRSPQRGNNNPMNAADFWNLAGRAGRWGKDFQGNIICIDPTVWDAPKNRKLMPLNRASDMAMGEVDQLVSFVENNTPRDAAVTEQGRLYESMISYLLVTLWTTGSLTGSKWLAKYDGKAVEKIESAIKERIVVEDIVREVSLAHHGISPLAIQSMLNYFKEYQHSYETLLFPYASDSGAVNSYAKRFGVFFGRLTNEFGQSEAYLFRQALATVRWMQGMPISRIISDRKKALPDEPIHNTIRAVFSDIESVARYKAPKYTSCYNDLLKTFLESKGEASLAQEIQDLTLYLEMGVSTKTQLSLINLGLSRTTAVEIKEYISSDELSELECVEWFRNSRNNWQSRSLPELVKLEIRRMLEMHT